MASFTFRPYGLHIDTLQQVMLTASGGGNPGCGLPDVEVSFTKAFVALRTENIRSALTLFGCKVVTNTCQHVLSGPDWALSLIATLLELAKQEADPFGSTWFYYADEDCREEPRLCVTFFLVGDQRIVAERVALFFPGYDDQTPQYLRPIDQPESVWTGQDAEWQASVADWYQQFYKTTHAGRVMVLREDEPALYPFDTQISLESRLQTIQNALRNSTARNPENGSIPPIASKADNGSDATNRLSIESLNTSLIQLRWAVGILTVVVLAFLLRAC